MCTPPRLRLRACDHGNVIAPYIKSYEEYLEAGRHKPKYRRRCIASVTRLRASGFAAAGRYAWTPSMKRCVGLFLSERLPRCDCPRPVPLELNSDRAALDQLYSRCLFSERDCSSRLNDELGARIWSPL